jgi:hypothetical protein
VGEEEPEEIASATAGWQAFDDAAREAGVLLACEALGLPHTATTVRVEGGRRRIADGPFIETKEQLGGFVLLDVSDLDEAMRWAERMPCNSDRCYTEIRPAMDYDAYAALIRALGDWDLAEEAVQDAFATAGERWPREGVPRGPAAVPGPRGDDAAAAGPRQVQDPRRRHLVPRPARRGAAGAPRRRAVAVALAGDLSRIDALAGYHYFHAARPDLLRRLEADSPAVEAYERALALAGNAAERAFLERRLAEMRA